MAINSGAFLAKENQDLQAAQEKQLADPKKESAPISSLLFKMVFLFRKVKAFYRAGFRFMKPYLLCLPNQYLKQKGLMHEHHHTAVIVM